MFEKVQRGVPQYPRRHKMDVLARAAAAAAPSVDAPSVHHEPRAFRLPELPSSGTAQPVLRVVLMCYVNGTMCVCLAHIRRLLGIRNRVALIAAGVSHSVRETVGRPRHHSLTLCRVTSNLRVFVPLEDLKTYSQSTADALHPHPSLAAPERIAHARVLYRLLCEHVWHTEPRSPTLPAPTAGLAEVKDARTPPRQQASAHVSSSSTAASADGPPRIARHPAALSGTPKYGTSTAARVLFLSSHPPADAPAETYTLPPFESAVEALRAMYSGQHGTTSSRVHAVRFGSEADAGSFALALSLPEHPIAVKRKLEASAETLAKRPRS